MIALIEIFHLLEHFILGGHVPMMEKKNGIVKQKIEEIFPKQKKPFLYIKHCVLAGFVNYGESRIFNIT